MDDMQDAEKNKVWAVLGYVLFLIPLLAAPKDSKFARYHTNQGLNFLILWVILSIVRGIVGAIYAATIYSSLLTGGWVAGGIAVTIVSVVISVVIIVFFILGLVNSLKGEKKPLPLIGKINILKVDM